MWGEVGYLLRKDLKKLALDGGEAKDRDYRDRDIPNRVHGVEYDDNLAYCRNLQQFKRQPTCLFLLKFVAIIGRRQGFEFKFNKFMSKWSVNT